MGFNKRVVSKNVIEEAIKSEKSLKSLFKADAVIVMDNVSTKVHELLSNGTEEREVIKLFQNGELK